MILYLFEVNFHKSQLSHQNLVNSKKLVLLLQMDYFLIYIFKVLFLLIALVASAFRASAVILLLRQQEPQDFFSPSRKT